MLVKRGPGIALVRRNASYRSGMQYDRAQATHLLSRFKIDKAHGYAVALLQTTLPRCYSIARPLTVGLLLLIAIVLLPRL